MIPAAFDYELADSPEHALRLLAEGGEDARLLAGGQSLLPLMRLRLATPALLVDIGRLADLEYVREDGGELAIGALTRHETLRSDRLAGQHCPILAHAAGEVGDPQVRHMGTIGGSVAHGDPAADLPSVLLALGATMVVQEPGGMRTIGVGDFFTGLFTTALGPSSLLTEVRVPKLDGGGWSYQKFNPRAQDWAVVGAAAVARGHDGRRETAVALTNMGETPLRATAVERALASGADPAEASRAAAEGTSPPSDPLGSAEYRRALAPVLVRRALEEALRS
ncbi:MAG TPA: xanthine dehydrogenase family protein subunit M [Actinomycetes bacterium]|nr:xanthine dehydrogenase family protein subunit M [Actinomycetes bacterium]